MQLSTHLKPQDSSTEPSTSKDPTSIYEISPKLLNAYLLCVASFATTRGQAALYCLPSTPSKPSHTSPSLPTYLAHKPSPIRHTRGGHASSNANTPSISQRYLPKRRPCLPGTKGNEKASCNPLRTIHRTPPHSNTHETETFTPQTKDTPNSSALHQILQSLLPPVPNCKLWCKNKPTV